MKAQVIQIRDVHDVASIEKVASLLDNGALVAIPTDTVYGIACRVSADSISRLNRIKDRDSTKHYTLHIGSRRQLQYYVPRMSMRAQKLAGKGLPGPLTIVFQLKEDGLAEMRDRVEGDVYDLLYSDGTIGIRYPDHPVTCEILSKTKAPVVAPSANPAGKPPATTSQEVADYFPDDIDYIVDVQVLESRGKISSTVVKISDRGVQLLREGVIPFDTVKEMSTIQILFVCTGNTCRSPMAEGICRKHLASILEYSVDELENYGYKVFSAGTTAYEGSPVSKNSAIVCRESGVDVGSHYSRLLDRELIEQSDLIYTMTRNHRDQVLMIEPNSGEKVQRLDAGSDISDPIGLGIDVYRQCFKEIQRAVVQRTNEII